MKKKPGPPPRPLKKSEVVRRRMKVQGAVTRIARAHLPSETIILAELAAIVAALQGATELVFLLSPRSTHVIVPSGSEPKMDAVVRATFTLSPESKRADMRAASGVIVKARDKALQAATHTIAQTRLPMSMQKR